MNITVLSIEPASESGTFNMIVLLDRERHQFTMTAETALGQAIPLIKGDVHFCKTFKWNQEASVKLYKLLSQFNRGDCLEFPINLGDFEFLEIERFSLKKEVKIAVQ
ncbi:MAG: hypothetical protein ACBR13_02090 [Microcoleus sp.]